ncbi:hypothetical protein HanRHA438_Chr14g0636391 [Helianthus annuus]|nr:hypothetical protein HanRHA438_Chr14g0636391 [Helianthus annuus]
MMMMLKTVVAVRHHCRQFSTGVEGGGGYFWVSAVSGLFGSVKFGYHDTVQLGLVMVQVWVLVHTVPVWFGSDLHSVSTRSNRVDSVKPVNAGQLSTSLGYLGQTELTRVNNADRFSFSQILVYFGSAQWRVLAYFD